ncbi:MAG TPA: GTPase CgtA, partial [Clostridiaceae bacterium]|nr:GTPase CgtA [Clostridiaceae bacterium]
IPGLIEGAHEGSGLGFEFLKHVERTKVLIHVVDISGIEGRDPIDDFDKINGELKMYNPELVKKMQVVAANKSDITGSEKNFIAFEKEMKTRGIKVFKVSAATNSNLKELMYYVSDMLDKIPEEKSNISLEQEYFKLDDEKDSKGY